MIDFEYPLLFLLSPLPVFVRWLVPAFAASRSGLRAPFVDRLARLSGAAPGEGRIARRKPPLGFIALVLAWLCVVVALARPVRVEEPVVETKPMRDLLVALDLSGSMETADMKDASGKPVSRLDAAKTVLGDFLERRKGDRTGLVFFGNAAFQQAPFTEDLKVCRALLDEARVRMAGPRTMLGDAIGEAVNIFSRASEKEKVLVLLTDGNDTGSRVPPAKAAEIAHEKGVVVHVIALGDPTTVGENKFDEPTLRNIAVTTGGKYFAAKDRDALELVCNEIDRLNPLKVETVTHRPVTELFAVPLAVAIVLSLVAQIALLLRAGLAGAVPRRERWRAAGILAFAALPAIFAAVAEERGFRVHFLRPAGLWLLVPAALLILLSARRADPRRRWRAFIDPELLDALVLSASKPGRIALPVVILALGWTFGVIALSGPAWRRESLPGAGEGATLIVAMKVAPSMAATDLEPSRQRRAVQKLSDLLALRRGGRTGLVAYAGSAHTVMPPTSDPAVLLRFAEALEPGLMPREGDAPEIAIAEARRLLAGAGGSGAILLMADDVPEAAGAVATSGTGAATVSVLKVLPSVAEFPGVAAAGERLEALASEEGGVARELTFDNADVKSLAAYVSRRADTGSQQSRWRDEGYLLVPLLALLTLVLFRRGFVAAPESV